MEAFGSRSCGDGRAQIEGNGSSTFPASGLHELRCYSTSHASSLQAQDPKDANFKNEASASGSSSSKGAWCFSDPEAKRKKRVAAYKVYAMEGKVKGSLRKSFRWLKDRLNGW